MTTNYQKMTTEELLSKASAGNLDEQTAYFLAMELERRFPSPPNAQYNFPKQIGNYRFVSFVVNVNH